MWTNGRFLLFTLTLLLLAGMSNSCGSAESPVAAKAKSVALVTSIGQQAIQITGSKAAVLDNEQLRCRFFLVRHAEKDSVGRDPGLLGEGKERAERLATIFEGLALRRIYATNYQRTQLTAAPSARSMHLKTQTYAVETQNELLGQLITQSEGGHYLIVGHSNTIPQMLNYLTGKAVYQNIGAQTYDDLFVASVYHDGRVDLLELKY